MNARATGFTILLLSGLFSSLIFNSAAAQSRGENLDEAKVGSYTLPDPLKAANGKSITSAQEWTQMQRPALLQLFQEHVYGKLPGKPKGLQFKVSSVDKEALGGKAIRKQITVFFTQAADTPSMEVLLYLPKGTKGPVPVFAGLNFYGNHTVNPDPGIMLSTRWQRNTTDKKVVNNRATEASRGMSSKSWEIEELISAGYGVATAYYGDLEPDHNEGWKTGIRTTLKSELGIKEDEWGAIGAWAWGLSRMLDYLETDQDVNAKQVAIMGHSRLGKAALWAAANDTRFALVISNNSGEGGAALARRNFGETIAIINKSFPYWFIPKYKEYSSQADKLPVDQHMLLALMAPHPLYVASAQDDAWADPKGEFLSAKNAEPVYTLFGKKGLGVTEMPPVNQPVGNTIRYHIRTGVHGITLYDWQQYIAFADQQFKK
ncbi:MAG: acetylxylan esterase [Flavisolibacter sp.]|nr:acetylxylan esterase [Flavisolibacter sp.]